MEFKKFPNKIFVHMKTFDKAYIRVLDHFLGREKHLSFFFRTVFIYVYFGYNVIFTVIKFVLQFYIIFKIHLKTCKMSIDQLMRVEFLCSFFVNFVNTEYKISSFDLLFMQSKKKKITF